MEMNVLVLYCPPMADSPHARTHTQLHACAHTYSTVLHWTQLGSYGQRPNPGSRAETAPMLEDQSEQTILTGPDLLENPAKRVQGRDGDELDPALRSDTDTQPMFVTGSYGAPSILSQSPKR